MAEADFNLVKARLGYLGLSPSTLYRKLERREIS
jgi:hypothetical protein